MSERVDVRIVRKVRICTWQNPLTVWEDYLSPAEIEAYRLAGYIVAEVDA
jgi:hypothetical protein